MKAAYTIQRLSVLLALLACYSCATPREVVPPAVPASESGRAEEIPQQPEAPSLQKAVLEMPPPPPPPRLKTSLKCQDDTREVFNSCGIDAIPFTRLAFYDIDNDGMQEMIAGTKQGSLNLYRNLGTGDSPRWALVEDYFEGIHAGAFSAPAAGDIDLDGRTELALGTGGFSSESGRVIFYKNFGMPSRPLWKKVRTTEIHVGNDATPALFDVDLDGRPDLIVGNSTGGLSLFLNRTEGGRIAFAQDPDYFRGIQLGLYPVPAVVSSGDRMIVIAGDDKGRLHILERNQGRKTSWSRSLLNIAFSSFASPAFISSGGMGRKDLVVSDGNGHLFYFKNRKGNYREWEEDPAFFAGRIIPGPACTPSMAEIDSRPYMVVGNISGEMRLYEYLPGPKGLPWREKQGFFRNIKLPGYARGVLADWQGRPLLITGDQDGTLRAFLNTGSLERPSWVEEKRFFAEMTGFMHAAPSIFDLDGDGRWELIVGDAEGHVNGFFYEMAKDGMPVWNRLTDTFREVKVDRYAAPSIFRDADKLYLLAGQQDGKINVFIADARDRGFPVFSRDEYLRGIHVENHSSPAAILKNGVVDLSIGDYNGNLKHFACEKTEIPAGEN